ncbi:fibroblast growth factor-binding protein 1-like [Hippocampus comes]|uniref:fibroblast growth factor-binding protein 1-like n=1 Tax=Hippocampus comes TaxID=109280 RepID=UPI00094ECE06|nr:PREDICTED: fibroblast growth factor-binding protein 1-like [Hippocampus comes]
MLRTLFVCLPFLMISSGETAGVPGTAPAVAGRGNFPYGGTMNCTWLAQERGDDRVTVSVKCEDPVARVHGGVTDRECSYDGKPRLCLAFRADPRGFWKQVSRSFRRLASGVCADDKTRVRARMCKGAPRDAHFKLDIHSSVISAQSGGVDRPPTYRPPATNTTACPETRKKAEEYCSSSWASVCTFFLSMVHNDC